MGFFDELFQAEQQRRQAQAPAAPTLPEIPADLNLPFDLNAAGRLPLSNFAMMPPPAQRDYIASLRSAPDPWLLHVFADQLTGLGPRGGSTGLTLEEIEQRIVQPYRDVLRTGLPLTPGFVGAPPPPLVGATKLNAVAQAVFDEWIASGKQGGEAGLADLVKARMAANGRSVKILYNTR